MYFVAVSIKYSFYRALETTLNSSTFIVTDITCISVTIYLINTVFLKSIHDQMGPNYRVKLICFHFYVHEYEHLQYMYVQDDLAHPTEMILNPDSAC